MKPVITITPATLEMLDSIIDLGTKLTEEEQAYEPRLTYNCEASLRHYQAELSNPKALIIAATLEDGTVIGYHYSYVETLEHLSEANRQCTLEALYVLPEYRGAGVGRLLTNNAQDWAINTQHVSRIVTHIYADNSASHQLHEAIGFKPYNTELIKYV